MKMLTIAATFAAVLVSAGTANAVPAGVPGTPGATPPSAAHRNQRTNDQNLKTSRREIERAIDTLSRDANDYGGHREAAMDDLGVARQFLEQALAFDKSHQRGNGNGGVPSTVPGGHPRRTPIPIDNPGNPGNPGGTPIPIDNPNGSGNTNVDADGNSGNDQGNDQGMDDNGNGRPIGQGGSNESLTDVRRHVENAIDALNRDGFDYGGFKVRAIDKLQAARSELDAALAFVHRPGVQNGGSGQHVSDANLRFVDEHVRTAIARLEQDRNDFGGHRVAAINDLQQARSFISSALSFDNRNNRNNGANGTSIVPSTVNTGIVNPRVVVPSTGGVLSSGSVGANGRVTNDQTLADARQHLETAIDALKRDAHDYNGFRVKAMDSLEAARTQILQAMNFRR